MSFVASVVLSISLLYCCVNGQVAPYISFRGNVLANNSYMDITLIGSYLDQESGLMCNTDLSTCCSADQGHHRGDWYFPDGERLYFNSLNPLYEQRYSMRVALFQRENHGATLMEGVYECSIETNAVNNEETRERVFIGLYFSLDGGDISIPDGIDFNLDSDLRASVPWFTLTTLSTGGPATSVTWTRDSIGIESGVATVLNDAVTAEYTHTLKVMGRLEGLYQCTVSNAKPSQSMAGLTVRNVDAPTNLVISQTEPNTLILSWTVPEQLIDVTGYRIYYDCNGGTSGSVDVAGSQHTSFMLADLIDGVSCVVEVIAMSVHLPSPALRHQGNIPIMRAPVITISRIEATWVEIEWSATNGVEQYRVTYERVIGAQQRGHCPQQHDSAVLDFSSTTTHATLSELEEYSSYYVTVIAKRGEESFVSSQQISFMTRSADASAPPEHVRATVLSSTSIKVLWSPIADCSAINGEITGWSVLYTSTTSKSVTVLGSNDANGEVILTGLIFNTKYKIQAAAVNNYGDVGVYSIPIFETTLKNAPPHVSAAFHSKTEIAVSWNQIQLAGWSSSNIFYQFTYYTIEHRYITRKSVELPADRTSTIVDVRDHITKLEHFFEVSGNLIVDGVTYNGLKGNTTFVFDKAFIQLQFGPVEYCINWLANTRNNPATDIEQQLHLEIMEAILQGCPECEQYAASTFLRSGTFICQSQPTMATYRTSLVNSGLSTCTTSLVSYIQDWVSSEPVVQLNHLLVRVNYDCPVLVAELSAPECTFPDTLSPNPQVISAFNACAIQSLGTQVCSDHHKLESGSGSAQDSL